MEGRQQSLRTALTRSTSNSPETVTHLLSAQLFVTHTHSQKCPGVGQYSNHRHVQGPREPKEKGEKLQAQTSNLSAPNKEHGRKFRALRPGPQQRHPVSPACRERESESFPRWEIPERREISWKTSPPSNSVRRLKGETCYPYVCPPDGSTEQPAWAPVHPRSGSESGCLGSLWGWSLPSAKLT